MPAILSAPSSAAQCASIAGCGEGTEGGGNDTSLGLNEINLLAPELWDGVSEEVQREILRQAEMMISSTLTLAIGTDSRIATSMSFLGAGGIALLGVAVTLIGSKHRDLLLIFSAATCSLGLLVASIICAFAIAPTRFLLPGASPQNLFSADAADKRRLRSDQQRLRAALIYSAQRAIGHNMTRTIISAQRFKCALLIAGAGVLAGIGFIAYWAAHNPF